MYMGDRPVAAPLTCPPQVLVLEESDFPRDGISSLLLRARESSVVGRFGKIFWVIPPDDPNHVLKFDELELRKWLVSLNDAAHATKENS
ncbi:MAG: hypothetical protein A2534_01385 [Candidatus Magasanikbacteria bacterium RIFOXYD2_FULL_39_9]|uniref:Uncharacterized protein n=1 Tax=Candidatus Magasanikbacteria bacterium RIFOXYD1_FULL_40_23 TaxID=1798705 RepID=A0A1F6P927_9BACT|nr:MAG: hypothetical protein A2534_01385 [Candidatus Magasanikbacteria bacterium RIFOXYD2_FULL_39_9]OGH92540.1 MAG: hypothetical protein A2563_02580 [Candidatus Magasanikbacteria bacterium RIFOXYD1_FULL_40_23]